MAALKSNDKVVENALEYMRSRPWDGLRQAYIERALAAGKTGDTREATDWYGKAYELDKILGKARVGI